MRKKIYVSIGVPGSGKTEHFLRRAKIWMFLGRKLVLALPTLKLVGEVVERCESLQLECKPIIGDETIGKRGRCLTEALQNGISFVITTHAALMEVDSKLLVEYILAVDEVPRILDVDCRNIKQADLDSLLVNLKHIENRLEIRHDKFQHVRELVDSYSRAGSSSYFGSACSVFERRIYDCLLHDGVVFIKPYRKDDEFSIATGKTTDFFEKVSVASEVHILTATLAGGVFHTIAQAKGFEFISSRFSPPDYAYESEVVIYPLCPMRWSKAKALTTKDGQGFHEHLGTNNQYIDEIISKAYHHNKNRPMLLFCNNWFNSKLVVDLIGVEACPGDNRGINSYNAYTAAVLVYSGQASPNHKPILSALEGKLGIMPGKLHEAWRVTEKLERALQDVTRTAIRKRGNTLRVSLYVQDDEVCEFLREQCIPNAAIDRSLMTPPFMINREPSETAKRDDCARDIIKKCLEFGQARSAIVKSLMEAGFGQSTAYKKINLHANPQGGIL